MARYNAYFGMGSGPVLLSNLYCAGTEDSLLDCNSYNVYGTLSCTHKDDAGVTCEGISVIVIVYIYTYEINLYAVPCSDRDVRLVASYPRTGRIELCLNNSWGTICTNTWNNLDASVACREFGYSPYGLIYSNYFVLTETMFTNSTGSIALFGGYDTNAWPTVMYGIACSGEETSLWNCSYSLFDIGVACGYDAAVICQGNCRARSYNMLFYLHTQAWLLAL